MTIPAWHSGNRHFYTDFFRLYAPDFCWCTKMELYLMAEQLWEEVDFEIFTVVLSQRKRDGLFITKPYDRNSHHGRKHGSTDLYLRKNINPAV